MFWYRDPYWLLYVLYLVTTKAYKVVVSLHIGIIPKPVSPNWHLRDQALSLQGIDRSIYCGKLYGRVCRLDCSVYVLYSGMVLVALKILHNGLSLRCLPKGLHFLEAF